MILVAWLVIAFSLISTGFVLWQPWWLVKHFQQRYYCARCHKDITETQKFQLEIDARESLEGRQV
jgi:hypothetical protein